MFLGLSKISLLELGLGRAGPAAACYFVFILDILDTSWIYLGYIFNIFLSPISRFQGCISLSRVFLQCSLTVI